ncbi:MAG: type II secretion system protein [bacterium]|nr:type II secretion system protein [bacterium]MDZ4231165.1 type II secretion system protein [Patescibacteria group bacterium]
MFQKSSKGFTLIEMLIVIAVISILAGIVLVGITGFQSSARDTKRIGDLRSIQNSLELYYTRCGFYPQNTGTANTPCTGGTAIASWDHLADAFVRVGIITAAVKLPNDSLSGKDYFYGVDGQGFNYVIGAELENPSSALDDPGVEIDDAQGEYSISGLDCTDANNRYCIGSS